MGCSSSIAEKYEVEEVRGGDIAPDAPSFHNDFELSRKLGKGAFGSVYLAWRRDGVREKVAVKVADLHQVPQGGSTTDAKSSVGMDSKSTVKITKSGLDTRRKRTTEKEVRVLKALPKSEYIVAYYADYCEGGAPASEPSHRVMAPSLASLVVLVGAALALAGNFGGSVWAAHHSPLEHTKGPHTWAVSQHGGVDRTRHSFGDRRHGRILLCGVYPSVRPAPSRKGAWAAFSAAARFLLL